MYLFAAEQSSPNVLGIPLDELILGLISFGVVFFVFARFALPAIRKALDERADQIEGGLERARRAQAEAQEVLARYREQLAHANQEVAVLRAQAQAERQAIIEHARQEALAAEQAIHERAAAQREAEAAQAKSQLSREVGRIAFELAEKIVGEALTDDERAKRFVDRFIADLEASADSIGVATPADGSGPASDSAPSGGQG